MAIYIFILTEQFVDHHQAEMEEAIARLQVIVVVGSRRLEDLKALEDK